MATKTGQKSTIKPKKRRRDDTVSKDGLCSSHPGEPLAIYCRTCVTLVCTECLDDRHDNHETKSAKKKLSLLRDEIAQTLPTLETRVGEQKEKLDLIVSRVETKQANFKKELGKRTKEEKDAVGQLEEQYHKVQEELEMHFIRKKEALQERMTLEYTREMTSRVGELGAVRDQLARECQDLDSIIADCRSRLALDQAVEVDGKKRRMRVRKQTLDDIKDKCDQLPMPDIMAVLPELQRLNKLPPTQIPAEHPPISPYVVQENMKRFTIKLDTGLELFSERVADLLQIPQWGDDGAVLLESFKQDCLDYAGGKGKLPKYQPPLTPGESINCKTLELANVSVEAGIELARLFGGGEVLIRENRHPGGTLIRTASGQVTHVCGWVWHRGTTRASFWFPSDKTVNEAVRSVGYYSHRIRDYHSEKDVFSSTVINWFKDSRHQLLRVF